MARVLAIDLGTGSLKAGVVDESLEVVAVGSAPVPTARDAPGMAEQSAEDWLSAMARAGRTAVDGAGQAVDAIVFTGHMSAPCLVNTSGLPIAPVRTLADTQCAGFLSDDPDIAARSGNLDGTHFGRAKIVQALAQGAKPSVVVAPKDVLRIAMGGTLASDPSDLANFLLIRAGADACDPVLSSGAGLTPAQCAPALPADALDGVLNDHWADVLGLPAGVPLIVGAGDMGTAAIGVGLGQDCDAAITIGTAATVLAAVPKVQPDLVGKLTYHLDGFGRSFALASHFNGGAVLDWLYRLSGTVEARNPWLTRLSQMAAARPDRSLPLVLPYLLGSGSPRFDRGERARITGLSAEHDIIDLIAAFQEGVAFDLADSIDALERAGIDPLRTCLGGGGARLAGWGQTISDTLGRDLNRPANEDLSLIGAAILGFRGLGIDLSAPPHAPGWQSDPARGEKLAARRAEAVALRG